MVSKWNKIKKGLKSPYTWTAKKYKDYKESSKDKTSARGIERYKNKGVGMVVTWVLVLAVSFFIIPFLWGMVASGFISWNITILVPAVTLAFTVFIAGGGLDWQFPSPEVKKDDE